MEKLVITSLGLVMVGFIYWFFFGKREEVVGTENGKIHILVDGGYKPGNIKVKKNIETELVFKRTDQNSCLEEVVIPDFKISQYLPMNEPVSIKITPKNKGEYDIHCGMNMFHGKIIVE
ncbi:MAG: cupredoxin domain-containing protein [Candidatus Woesebacteria bacterium]|nr:MAG: cupredoxin domain-containing protein [Candidatus Woesebacteria bacterium]